VAKEEKARDSKEESFFGRSTQFFRDAWAELKKVYHPTRQETIQATAGVLVLVAFFALFLGAIDLGIGQLMQRILL
jgi:preprotein translocase subunit SecE